MINKRIFIVGVPRSGTTLLQSLLATHSLCTSFTESHLFSGHFRKYFISPRYIVRHNPMPRVRSFLAENGLHQEEINALTSHIDLKTTTRHLKAKAVGLELVNVLDQLAITRGYVNWIEKTPKHLHFVPFIESLHQGQSANSLHFIHIIRNGLDTVSSLYKTSQMWGGKKSLFKSKNIPPYSLTTCIDRWNADMSRSINRMTCPRDHFVFYEELIAQPEEVLAPIFAKLGLDWEANILDSFSETTNKVVTASEVWKNVGNQLIQSKSSDIILTAEEQDFANAHIDHGLYEELYDKVKQGF